MSGREPNFDMPPLGEPAAAPSDAEISEMTQKFEQTFAELSQRTDETRGQEADLLFALPDTERMWRQGLPEPAAEAFEHAAIAVPPPVRLDAEPRTSAAAQQPAPVESAWREGLQRPTAAMVICAAVAFVGGATSGFIVAKRTTADEAAQKVTAAAYPGGLRLDYELKHEPGAAPGRKP